MQGLELKKPKRTVGGRPRKDSEKYAVLSARCRVMNLKVNAENMAKVDADHYECAAGQQLAREGFDKDVWEVMKEIRNTYLRYYQSIGVNPSEQGANPAVVPTAAEILLHEPARPQPTPEQRDAMDVAASEAVKRIDRQLLQYIPNQSVHVKDVLVYGKEPKSGFVGAVRSFYQQRSAK